VGPGPNFTSASSVDGGAGSNELEIAVQLGALLGAGVGPNITNIQFIEHRGGDGFPAVTGDISVDMSRSGSANELDLVASYNNNAVSVTNLTNTKTVLYEGRELAELDLAHTTPLGLLDVINFTMAADGESPGQPGVMQLNSLFVGPGLA